MDLPRRLFGGVDRAAAERAVDEQRRTVVELTEHLARVERQLEEVRAERDESASLLREMQRDIADVLRLATRAAVDTEDEAARRVAEATEQAQKQVDDLAVEAATSADTALALAEALQAAVDVYRSRQPIQVVPDEAPPPLSVESTLPAPVDATQSPVAAPEEPFVLDETEPAAVLAMTTSVVARPLPSPAAAVDVEQRLAGLDGVREVVLRKLGSTEAEYDVVHDGPLDLTPLTRVGVPVSVSP